MSIITKELENYSNITSLVNGGQKKVFLGERNGHKYVLKRGHYDSESLVRMEREVSVLRNLDTEFYPRNYDFFIEPATREFLIVEQFIENIPFKELRNYLDSEEKLIELLLLILEGLNIVWDKDIVHRDLKPDNILIRPNYRPVIIDLGVARFIKLADVTGTHAPCTPAFAAPEFLNYDKENITYRSDIFSLGIYSVYSLKGIHPFNVNGDPIDKNIKIGNIMDLNQCGVSKGLTKILKRMMEHEPYMRYRMVQDLISDLESL